MDPDLSGPRFRSQDSDPKSPIAEAAHRFRISVIAMQDVNRIGADVSMDVSFLPVSQSGTWLHLPQVNAKR